MNKNNHTKKPSSREAQAHYYYKDKRTAGGSGGGSPLLGLSPSLPWWKWYRFESGDATNLFPWPSRPFRWHWPCSYPLRESRIEWCLCQQMMDLLARQQRQGYIIESWILYKTTIEKSTNRQKNITTLRLDVKVCSPIKTKIVLIVKLLIYHAAHHNYSHSHISRVSLDDPPSTLLSTSSLSSRVRP